MKEYILLLRPKDWIKNLFLFIPSFFAGTFFGIDGLEYLVAGFLAFSFLASSIYIINDYRDIEDDRKHPVKSKRPVASGKVNKTVAIVLCIGLVIAGAYIGYLADKTGRFLLIPGIYYFMNLGYCLGLKNIAILDLLILSSGFVLRVKAGGAISNVYISQWLLIMTFLLASFMAVAKRRDDMLLKMSTGTQMRKSSEGYNLDFLNTMLSMFSAIIIVAYIMYTVDAGTLTRMRTHRLYYTSIFVIAGVLRYLQITMVQQKSASPTKILYEDRFIQVTILLWIGSFYFILYLRDFTIFNR